ncbi:hypothetical protein SUGI_0570670 [Cryptomeria japonica]|nr:hypothetical protein SUGI_0570670 [Cryptomeria japonica]
MRRSSTRKSNGANSNSSTHHAASTAALTSSAANKAAAKELERIDALFQRYADQDSLGMIGPEQIEDLCMDLGVEIMDVKVLMLAWKMRAARQGYFTLEEWRKGLKALKVDTIDKLKKALPSLEQEVMRPNSFLDFYTYSFRYCLTEERQKSLDMESVCQLLELVLGKRNHAQVASLVEFLKNQKEYKAINLDQWLSFLRFCDEVKYPSFDDYDSTLAWPLILDQYVEWEQERRS